MKKIVTFLASALTLVTLFSCSDEEETNTAKDEKQTEEAYAAQATVTSSDANYVAGINGGTINFKTEGGTATITVSCGCNWIAENSATDLFTTSTTSSSLTVTAEQNTVEEELTGTITFMTETYRITFATFYITQTAYGAPEITVELNEWNVPAKGNLTTEIAVTASADWTAEAADAWLTVSKGGDSITLTAEENGDTKGRSTRVTLTCTDGIRTAREYVAVTQDALAHLTLSNEFLSFGGEGGSALVTVESNYDWEYSYDTSNGWLKVSQNNEGLTVTVVANDGDEREEVVALSAGDGAENVAEAQLTITQTGNTAMILTYTITSANTSTRLPIYGTVDCTVDWGDGTVETITSNRPSHTYAIAGDYDVSINGTVTALYSNGISSSISPLPLTAVKQWGKTGLTDMSYGFYYCSNLTSLPDEVGNPFAEVTSFNYAFYYCSSLTTIPEGTFEGCSKATGFQQTFRGCSALKSIPTNMFKDCVNVTSFQSVFYQCTALEEINPGTFTNCSSATNLSYIAYGCTALKTIPSDMFANCTKNTTFYASFYNCSALTELPAGLFDDCTDVEDYSSCFYGCKTIPTIPTGLFDKTVNVTTFFNIFNGCSGFTAIPEGLFDNCPEVTSFQQAFSACTSLATIPDGLFDNCPKVTKFQRCFYKAAITKIPEGLFDKCPEVTSFEDCFDSCKSLTSIPSGLFDKCTKVTSFRMTFTDCTSLTGVPEKLFDNCPDVTDLESVFYGCSALKSLPERLFYKCTKVTNLSSAFYECSSLETVPEGLFDNCSAVEDLSFLFSYCTVLKSVPQGLFDDCTEVTTFMSAFQNTSLTSLPNDLFSKNLKVTDFSYCFNGGSLASSLTGESPYDVIDGEKVHLYERENYPDIYVTPTNTRRCFYSCTGLTDYDEIPDLWVN